MKIDNPRGLCEFCQRVTDHQMTYAGFEVGWWCKDHRPDNNGVPKKVEDLLPFIRQIPINPDDPEYRPYILPYAWSKKDHPFHATALPWVKGGKAEFDTAAITFQAVSKTERKKNRAERRRL